MASIVANAMLYPGIEEAKHIGSWRHEAKVDAMPTMSFSGTTFDFSRLEYGGWVALQSATRDQIYWPGAAFHIADSSVGEAYANGVRKAFAAEQLLSNPLLGGISICPDLGAGYDARREGKMAMNVNVFGRGFFSTTIKNMGPEAYQKLRLVWPAARAVIQLDRVTLSIITDNGIQQVELTAQPATKMIWQGVSPVEGGAVIAPSQAVTILDLESFAPPVPHSLDLDVRFKYLQLDSILSAG